MLAYDGTIRVPMAVPCMDLHTIEGEVVPSNDQLNQMTEVFIWWCLCCSGVEGMFTGVYTFMMGMLV